MRFALIVTSVAAAVIGPFAATATAPQMSSDAFLSAVRCAAYAQAVQPGPSVATEKAYLNAEARRQPAETVVQARKQASLIMYGVVNATESAMVHQQGADACGAALAAQGGKRQEAV